MGPLRRAVLVGLSTAIVASCAATRSESGSEAAPVATTLAPADPATTTAPTASGRAAISPQARPTAAPSPPTTTTTTTPPSTTSTTIPLPEGLHDPSCARVVQSGQSLSLIADGIDDPTVTGASLQTENGIADPLRLEAGAVIDVCPGNGIDDLTGDERPPEVEVAATSGVAAQQRKLNELFAGTGMPELAVDGVSGSFTRQHLCAARVALDLPISRDDMEPGSLEEIALMGVTSLTVPPTAAQDRSRWILIDTTCQVLFAGDGPTLAFVFPTSTGEPGWETRNHERIRAYRYDPALDNGGWHNSSRFPVPEDNPLNGNMYKPLYFDGGQAIHGANNVPTTPASKGCARLRPESQDALLFWLGLTDVTEATYDTDRINAVVTVQGQYVP